jgi:tetratricopeptide (TPR) repeat protein
MFRKVETGTGDDDILSPPELTAVEGLDEYGEFGRPGPRTWLWTLLAALAVVLLMAYVLVLGGMGVYHGLKDRTIESKRSAKEHYALGLTYLEKGDYELAIAEFDLALRQDPSLREAQTQSQQAKELAKAQATPTSETRQDAAKLLYREAVAYYEGGNLAQAVAVLDELRGLDPNHQRENVAMMLTTAHYQLGLNAVAEDRLDEAAAHFEAVLALKPGDTNAQDQLNLIHLYTAALSFWERDWSATIQALKGLYSLAPGYKDVQARLRGAYGYRAQAYADKGDWCRAADDYAAAVDILPLDTTVDLRDDALMRCQATAEAPSPSPTARATARPTSVANVPASATPGLPATSGAMATKAVGPTPTPLAVAAGEGRIAFTSFDILRQRYDIYVVDLSQGDARLLQENANQPAFAPGGQRLAFRNVDPRHLGIGVLNLRSTEVSEVTIHPEDSTPAWSPDANQIIFASDKEGDRRWRLYAISPGEVRGEGEQWAFGQMPAWSPDGSRLAYHGCDEHGDNCGVWVMLAGGFKPGCLTSDASDTAPAWSPDGTGPARIAFISARAGNWELYLVDVASGQEKRLTDHPAADVAPTWSPDGKWLAFLSNREGGWAVYVLDVKSGQVQKCIATGDAYPDAVSERLSWVP